MRLINRELVLDGFRHTWANVFNLGSEAKVVAMGVCAAIYAAVPSGAKNVLAVVLAAWALDLLFGMVAVRLCRERWDWNKFMRSFVKLVFYFGFLLVMFYALLLVPIPGSESVALLCMVSLSFFFIGDDVHSVLKNVHRSGIFNTLALQPMLERWLAVGRDKVCPPEGAED